MSTTTTAPRLTFSGRGDGSGTYLVAAYDGTGHFGRVERHGKHWTAYTLDGHMLDGWYSTRADAGVALYATTKRRAELDAMPTDDEDAPALPPIGDPRWELAKLRGVAIGAVMHWSPDAAAEQVAEAAADEDARALNDDGIERADELVDELVVTRRHAIYGTTGDGRALCVCGAMLAEVDADAHVTAGNRPTVQVSPAAALAMPARNVRVADALWDAATARAQQNGTTVSAVIRSALAAYVAG